MKKAVQTLVALAILSVPLAASAQDPRRPAPPTGDPVTRYTFDDHPVPGRDYAPSEHPLFVRRQPRTNSLIRVREHFVNEMRKSVEHL